MPVAFDLVIEKSLTYCESRSRRLSFFKRLAWLSDEMSNTSLLFALSCVHHRDRLIRLCASTIVATLWPKHQFGHPERIAVQWVAERQQQ